jgi:type IV secretion system protein VirB3
MAAIDDEQPALTPVVLGLTRPPTLWGVPYMAVVLAIGLTIIAWLASSHLLALLVAPIAYLILFSLCAFDGRFLEVLQVACQRTPRTANLLFWGTTSYGP